jgi:hypothetical protein
MKNLLKEEINDIKYLFGYKKGVVISEQNELSPAPEQLFTYINGQKELNTAFLGSNGEVGKFVGGEVKKWCKDNAPEGSVCVLGRGVDNGQPSDKERVKTLKLPGAIKLASTDGYTIVKVNPTYIGAFEETYGDGTKQTKHYWGTVYSKS